MGKKKHRSGIKRDNYQYTVNVDGACAGNPGLMGIGGVIVKSGETIHSFSEAKGFGTNNEAEYLAVITALEYMIPLCPESVIIISDSQLVVNQINGMYGINYPHLAKLFNRVQTLIKQIGCPVDIVWASREDNKEADALASAAAGMPMAPISDNGSINLWIPDPDYRPDADKLTELPELNWECERGIRDIVRMGGKAKFGEYAALRTGGFDGYSKTDTELLKYYISVRFGQDAVDWLVDAVGEETEYARKVFRWAARGLPPDMALKKVSVDTEITANAVNKRRVVSYD